MKSINLIISVLILICAVVLLLDSIINQSPMKLAQVSIHAVIVLFAVLIIKLVIKEIEEDV